MANTTFTSQRSHTRVKFSPLRTSCHLVCLTPMSPAAQTLNAFGAPEYEPDRTITPTLIYPDVRAIDSDRIFTSGAANKYISLDEMNWYVNDTPISEVWEAATDYTIDVSETDTRGMLKIMKNIPVSERAILRFKATFLDWRTGIAYVVESNDMMLTCTDKGGDVVSCSIDKPIVYYDPTQDDLLKYDYLSVRGGVVGERADYVNGKCYEQTITALLNVGTEEQTTLHEGITMQLVAIDGNVNINSSLVAYDDGTTLSYDDGRSVMQEGVYDTSHPEVLVIDYPHITFDMRLIDKADYTLAFMKDGVILASSHIGLQRNTTMPSSAYPLRSADITPSQDVYFNKAYMSFLDSAVDYPELYYLIHWHTQAKHYVDNVWTYDTAKDWQYGENIRVAISDIGVGNTSNDSFFDLYFEASPHNVCDLASDENGEVLTDENNEPLIF